MEFPMCVIQITLEKMEQKLRQLYGNIYTMQDFIRTKVGARVS